MLLLSPQVLWGKDVSRLKADVEFLSDSLCRGRGAGTVGAVEACAYVTRRFRQLGLEPQIQTFVAAGKVCRNVIAEKKGKGRGWVLICAHYDGIGELGGQFYPGADCNASGVAAMLALADSLDGPNVIFAALDAHYCGQEGARLLHKRLAGRPISMVVSLETVGSSLAPPHKYWPDYLIALGGLPYRKAMDPLSAPLHLSFDYYGSKDFTDLFYRRMSDAKPFIDAGVPSVVFTSGITDNTNHASDTAASLDYGMLSDRVHFIRLWLESRR